MKKFVVCMAVVVAAFAAQASYLYWQVDADDVKNFNKGVVTDVIGAIVYADNGSQKSELSRNLVDNGALGVELSKLDNEGVGYSFYIELIGYDTVHTSSAGGPVVIGTSKVETYQDLVNANNIVTLSTIPQMSPWHGTGYAVPEPTSAMMMMVGVALMALRRRKE